MRNPANPFILTGYHSPEYFCDREVDLAWLMDQVNNERNSVLYSWRRMGKTALVSHLFHLLDKSKKADGIFVDLMGTSSLPEANRHIASSVMRKFGNTQKGLGAGLLRLLGSVGATVGLDPLNGTPQVTFGLVPASSVPASLEAMGNFLAERKKTVILCLDEFQQVVNYPEAHAEATFRSWTQSFPMVRFIFSGSHRHMMESMFNESSRPFYGSAQLRNLAPLPVEEYSNFIISHFENSGKSIEPSCLDRIFDWTRRQTYYVQLVCNLLFGNSDHAGPAETEDVFAEMIRQAIPLFSSYQQLLTVFQWKLLVAIAKAEKLSNPLSQDFLLQYQLGAASSVSTALKTLVKKEFVIYQDRNYTLHDTLLMRWLQEL